MEHKGDIKEYKPVDVFAYVAGRRSDGVIYFRDPDGLSAFVTVKEGVPFHCGGSFGEGDTAMIGIIAMEKGTYNFVEDIKTDEATFPRNISLEITEILTSGKGFTSERLIATLDAKTLDELPDVEITGRAVQEVKTAPIILPAGQTADCACTDGADVVVALLNFASTELSGLLVAYKDDVQLGMFIIRRGERIGGYMNTNAGVAVGDEAVIKTPVGCKYRCYELGEELLPVYADAVRGSRLIVRTTSAAINPEEFYPID